MTQDYKLTEKDARLDKLTLEERTQLQDEMNERNNDYMVFHVHCRDISLGHKYNAILNIVARQVGFDGYYRDGRGNTFMDWNAKVNQPEDVRDKLQNFNRLLEASPEYAQFQLESEKATAEDMQFFADSTQQMFHAALRIAIPRLLEKNEKWELPTDHKPVILTANDVKSILLQPEESASIEKGRTTEAFLLNKEVFEPIFSVIHKVKDKEMDNIARQAGFEQFEENEQGTGLRNYTAQGKTMTPTIKQQVAEYERLYHANPLINKCLRHFSRLLNIQESMLRALNQIMHRNILAKTNPRITRMDVEGKPILTAKRYLETIKDMEYNERARFNAPYVTTVKTIKDGKEHNFQVDRGIATFVQLLNDAGYVTGQSCSGLLEDHPNARYVEDSKHGLFVKGDPINLNKQGCGTYLTFYKPVDWDENLILNNEKQIANIRSVAQQQGWIVEDMHIFGMPSVRLGLPLTYDGYGTREILHEANDIVNRQHPGLEKEDFFKWLELRSAEEQRVIARHGGVVRWTDDMVKKKWNGLTQALTVAEKQRQDMERISDVRIYVGGDGYHRIKCRIDGVDMLSERFSDVNIDLLNKGTDEKELAYRCYKEYFQQEQQSKSLKR